MLLLLVDGQFHLVSFVSHDHHGRLLADLAYYRQPVLLQPHYRLLRRNIVHQQDEVAGFHLGGEVGGLPGVDDLGEDVLGVRAHVWRKDHFFVDLGDVGGEI